MIHYVNMPDFALEATSRQPSLLNKFRSEGWWRTLKIKGAFSQRLGRMGSLNMSQSSMPFFDQ
jgi:hypothetical protein